MVAEIDFEMAMEDELSDSGTDVEIYELESEEETDGTEEETDEIEEETDESEEEAAEANAKESAKVGSCGLIGSKPNRLKAIVMSHQGRKIGSSPYSYDTDEECCRSPPSPPPDVPEDYLGVYVGRKGEDLTRFIIPTAYLAHPFFRALLDRAEDEFGFDRQGGLTIPCEVSLFNQLLRVLGSDDPASETLRRHDLLEFFSNERDCGSQAKALNSFPLYSFGFKNLML